MAGSISTVDLSGIVTDIAAVKTVVDAVEAIVALNAVAISLVDTKVDALAVDLALARVDITAIRAITDALAVLTESGGTVTTDGGEQNVYVDETPAGVFRPICVKIKTAAHTAAETIVIREYYRIASGGDYGDPADEVEFAGLIEGDEITIDLAPNRYGVKVTIQKTAGANRAYPWEVVYEV